MRFDKLTTDFSNRAAAHQWREARNAINAGEMPPEDEPQLTASQRETITTWIENAMRREIERQQSTGGRVVMRRLNRAEYHNTMSDLLGLEMDYTRDLPPDAVSPEGFRNDGRALRMSAMQLEYYLETARRALSRVLVTGLPPKVYRHQFTKSNVGGWRGPTEQSNHLERAQKFLVKMVDDYPESGAFCVRVQTRATIKPGKGVPILECAVGYRPDTEVHFRVAGTRAIVSEGLQQIEFRGRLENFPLPVRGQGKYPGLVVRLRNVYDDGTPVPSELKERRQNGKSVKAFRPEPHLPALDIEAVEFVGPVYASWPPEEHRAILFDSERSLTNEPEYVRQVLTRFMTRAYRRPPSRFEVEEMFAFFASIRPFYTSFVEAMRETLAMVLVQPDFLYQLEPGGDTKRSIGDWELATRLSYFLWSTMPDERLFEFAEGQLLSHPTVLRSETERMLRDERFDRFNHHFVTQWLRLRGVETVAIDHEAYPDFRDGLKSDMQRETIEFFAEVLRSGGSALQLLDSDFTMMNEPLARHYGMQGVYGREFRRVQLPANGRRGGLVGHASVLLANSTGKDSHPIRRAVWIRDRLLGDPPAPPPPDVPELDEADPEFANLTVREQLQVHRQRESCASCHRSLDPWGIALENFDAVGLWRDSIRKPTADGFVNRPLDATDELPGGTQFDGPQSLREHLVGRRTDDFAHNLVRRLLTYALGRALELTDEEEIAELADRFKDSGFNLRELILDVTASRAFRTK